MIKKAKHITFGQHNLDLFSNKATLPSQAKAWQDRQTLRGCSEAQPIRFTTGNQVPHSPVSDDCGTECVLWCCIGRVPVLLQPKLKLS